jgi:hypothetical protein
MKGRLQIVMYHSHCSATLTLSHSALFSEDLWYLHYQEKKQWRLLEDYPCVYIERTERRPTQQPRQAHGPNIQSS